jgi:hypothetical protein
MLELTQQEREELERQCIEPPNILPWWTWMWLLILLPVASLLRRCVP